MILFIDDGPRLVKSYADFVAVELGVKTECIRSIDDFMEKKDDLLPKTQLLVLDLMMPPGFLGMEQTESGFRTGFVLIDRLRTEGFNLPIIILTNANLKIIHPKPIEQDNLKLLEKMQCLPEDLCDTIKYLLQNSRL